MPVFFSFNRYLQIGGKNKMKLRLLYGKDYKNYHLEEVKNQYGKVLEYQIVEN